MKPDRYHATRLAWDPRREVVWREIARYLQPCIPIDGALLELGAGHCHFINNIRAARRVALDASDVVTGCVGAGVTPIVQSCTRLDSLPDGTFDVVFASNLLEHLTREDASNALSESRRVLRADGLLILIQPNFRYSFREYFDDFTHETVWTHISLTDFVEGHDFRLIRLDPKFMPFSVKSRLPVHPLLVRAYLHSPIRPFAGQMLLMARRWKGESCGQAGPPVGSVGSPGEA